MLSQAIRYILFIALLFNVCRAQPPATNIAKIEKALADKKVDKAVLILQSIIDSFYTTRKADSLVNYIFYVGKTVQANSGAGAAVKTVQAFIEKIKTLSPSPATLRQTYIEAGEYYGSAGLNDLAYNANEKAYKYTLLIPAVTPDRLGQVENNLSAYAQRKGDLSLSKMHSRNAMKNLLADKKQDYELLYIACNSMGSAMWYTSKTDSSIYYFNKALEALAKTQRTPLNQFYRPAIVQNNISGVYQLQGRTTEAIEALKSSIKNIKNFLSTKEPHPKKVTATTFQFEATDNLAGFYKELGDLKKAKELLEYSYRQKQEQLAAGDPAIFISQILLGQLYFAQKDYNRSLQYLNNGLEKISASGGDYLFWQADACNTLALLHDAKHNTKQAAFYYAKADSLYEQSLQGEYDNIYLDFLNNASLFYAENGQFKTALAKAGKGYNYVVKTQGATTLPAFYQLLNLSEVNFLAGRFKEAIGYSEKGLEAVNNIISTSDNLLDSIRMELKKPKAILLRAKAAYQLLSKKNVGNLTALLQQLQEALAVLERRKAIINDAGDISLLLADHEDLLEFVKKITFELYQLTNDGAYVDQLLSLHESGIYNRIRSRLDKNDSLKFAHIPATVQATEKQLKNSVTAALKGNDTHNEKMQRYFKATDSWNRYQEKIRTNYPRYYQMRYASIFKSLGEIQKDIPSNTTLIRYFSIGNELVALVAGKNQKQLYSLDKKAIEEQIEALSLYAMDEGRVTGILYELYRQLWLPLVKSIDQKKVVIIPDGILYNLNFEILTPQKITAFRELGTKSLLAGYTISYQYSLFLLGQTSKATSPANNFIAFAPGFSDKIKETYKAAAKDSIEIDRAYLSLLPQPFTLQMAAETQQLFGGSAYLNELSTESSFKTNAGHHKIIHIGTHAESNNDYPEFSRLIFAKSASAGWEDNSLYLDEIYNCDLTSNLTVLTACESGKPGYQDGEGMISLAHAFNYAGSESILTGLWKIDEQASALLLDIFYENLLMGLPKDEALRQAKLTYLQQAQGRMLAPQYWAGLVIMGDVSALAIEPRKSYSFWLITGIVLLLALAFLVYKRNALKRRFS